MNNKNKKIVVCVSIIVAFLLRYPIKSEASDLEQPTTVTIEDNGKTDPVDPENPGEIVDPGPSPSINSSLRIDFVSSLDFGKVKIKDKNRVYPALAQNFYGNTEPRGSYVQISDRREIKSGWTLQLKQEIQFRHTQTKNKKEQDLTGTVLSLDNGWANSITGNPKPEVYRNTILLNNIGQSYEVATSKKDVGKGIWTINFGASIDNQNGQKDTLIPALNEKGEVIMDSVFQKPAYYNSAITLSIPDSIKIYPVQYQTELTWILSELP